MTTTLIKRADDLGWLASTSPDHPYRITVVAPTETEADALLAQRIAAWDALGESAPTSR